MPSVPEGKESMTAASCHQSGPLAMKVEEIQVLPEALSPVAAFYKGKSVFITGATGFMGKVTSRTLPQHLL